MARDPISTANALSVILALACVLAVCTACGQPLPTPSALFEISTPNPGDTVSFTVRDKVAQFEIYSQSGIGKARIVRTSTLVPQELLLNFHLHGLEHLTFSFGERSVEIEIPSSGDHTPLDAFPPDSPLWMPVKIYSRDNAYPIRDGMIQVQPPRAFYDSGLKEFSIEWIDFYR